MLVEVALPLPLPRTFTYRVPAGFAEPGTRVRVTFGTRKLMGWIVGLADTATDVAKIRDIDALLETEPSLTADVLQLCRWVSDYYVLPLGQVLRTALPAVLSGGVKIDEPAKTRRVVRLVRELPSLQEREEMFRRAQRQRELYEVLEALGGTDDVAHLSTQLGFSHAIIKGLVARQLAVFVDERVDWIRQDPGLYRAAQGNRKPATARRDRAGARNFPDAANRGPLSRRVR
jgi:primosomal protein N'